MKRFRPRAKGRAAPILKPYSSVTIILSEVKKMENHGTKKLIQVGFRLGINRGWDSAWYAKKKDFGNYLIEDFKIREYKKKCYKFWSIKSNDRENFKQMLCHYLHI